MPEPIIALLIGSSLASLIASLVWAARQRPDRRSREVDKGGAYCVWCLYRRGDICTHPGSPVYREECGPVCTGRVRCELKQERWQW